MKRLFILLIVVFSFTCSFAQNQADKYYNQGIDAYTARNYNKAIELFSKCEELNQSSKREMPYYSNNASHWIARAYYNLGNEDKAKEVSQEYTMEPVDQRLTIESDKYGWLAIQSVQNGDWLAGEKYSRIGAEIEAKELGENHYYLANTLYVKGLCELQLGEWETAYSIIREALKIMSDKQNYYIVPQIYATYSSICDSLGYFKEAIESSYRAFNLEMKNSINTNAAYPSIYALSNASVSGRSYNHLCRACNDILSTNLKNEQIDSTLDVASIYLSNAISDYCECKLFNKADSILLTYLNACKYLYNDNPSKYFEELRNLSSRYSMNGNLAKSVEILKMLIYQRIERNLTDELFKDFHICAHELGDKGDLKEAIVYEEEAISNLPKDSIGTKSHKRFYGFLVGYHCRINIASYPHFSKENISWIENNLNNIISILGFSDFSTHLAYMTLGLYYRHNDDILKLEKLEKFFANTNFKDFEDQLNHNVNLISSYEKSGNYQKALDLIDKTFDHYPFLLNDSSKLCTILNIKALCLNGTGRYSEAIEVGEKVVNLRKELDSKKEPIVYAISLANLALYYTNYGRFSDAIDKYKKALAIERNSPKDYYHTLANLSIVYGGKGDYNKAISLGDSVITFYHKNPDVIDTQFALSLNNNAWYYMKINSLEKAYDYYNEALLFLQNKLGIHNIFYYNTKMNIGGYYDYIGQHDKALKVYLEVIRDLENNHQTQLPIYRECLHEISVAYLNKGSEYYKDALNFAKKSYECYEKNIDVSPIKLAEAQSHLADNYEIIHEYDSAMIFIKPAWTAYKSYYGINNPQYAKILESLSNILSGSGKTREAIMFEKEALDIYEKCYGQNSTINTYVLHSLSINYHKIRNFKESAKCIQRYITCERNNILKNFAALSNMQRFDYWNDNSYLFDYPIIYGYNHKEDSLLSSLSYDVELFRKGIILSSNSTLKNIIEEGNNNDLKEKYAAYTKLISQASNCVSPQTANRIYEEADSISRLITKGASST